MFAYRTNFPAGLSHDSPAGLYSMNIKSQLLGRQWMALLLVLILLWGVIGGWILLGLGLIALYFIIRWCADIFWWGKDNGKW